MTKAGCRVARVDSSDFGRSRLLLRERIAGWAILFLPLVLIGCGPTEKAAPEARGKAVPTSTSPATSSASCPDLQGKWSSAVFHPLEVAVAGTHETRGDTSTTLEVVHQEGCLFQANNTVAGSTVQGSEPVAGVINAESGEITMVEIGPHPQGDSSALITARLVAPNQMIWEYVGLTSDDTRGEAFTTGLHRGATPPERASCPDITGAWSSAVFHPLKVFVDGKRETQAPTSTTLKVVYQDGCQFQAINTWSAGKLGGSEPVIGTISGESGVVTMREIGPHPKGGSSALILGRLLSKSQMTWEYIGLADDASMGQVFTTGLQRGSQPPERASCPDLMGSWGSTTYQPLEVQADGTLKSHPATSTTLKVVYQEGCSFQAVDTWSNDEESGSEPVAGTINGETGAITMTEVGPHPASGSSGLILANLTPDKKMRLEYLGLAADNSTGHVFVTELARK